MTTITISITPEQVELVEKALAADKAFDDTVDKRYVTQPSTAHMRIVCYGIARSLGFVPVRPGSWRPSRAIGEAWMESLAVDRHIVFTESTSLNRDDAL